MFYICSVESNKADTLKIKIMAPKEMTIKQLKKEIKEIKSQLNINENPNSFGSKYLKVLNVEFEKRNKNENR